MEGTSGMIFGMQMTSAETAPYGEWPSPISGADVARMQVSLAFPTMVGTSVWWQEGRPSEGGRQGVVCLDPDGTRWDILPMPWNARTRVHEYGGKSFLALPDGLVFANFDDQRLYRAGAGAGAGAGEPSPLTAAPDDRAADRFADFVLSPDGTQVWCVRERHCGGRITRAIVAVPLDGSAAADSDAVRVLVSGSDFFAFPAPSPDGTQLAWICWDHPRMPWDGAELRVAAIGDTGNYRVVAGGDRESVLAPVWRDDHSLYLISDRSGWWNLYLADVTGPAAPRPLCPREEEFAWPLWQLGVYPYAVLGDGRIAVSHGTGESRIGVLDPETGLLADFDLSYEVLPGLSAFGQVVAALANGPTLPASVIGMDIAASGGPMVRELCRSTDSLPDAGYLPVPRAARLAGPSGSVVHALVYPPTNPAVTAPDGELPPYIVWVHGGPTAHVFPRLELDKAYFTSRGIGIVDVNYGGSSGYGREYRERLRGQWGIVDVADVIAAALALAADGEADGKRLGIRGGSAGGWTALAAVTTGVESRGLGGGVFAAAASYFGVTDLRGFAALTHDFESRYLDGLIGPLPESNAVYLERAPLGHVNDATCPILLLQGLDDPIVPPAQAEALAADLAAHGIRYAYLPFAGESHGFRKAENIIASLEAELSFYGQIMGFTPPGVPMVTLSGGEGGR
jgi:dipeptidyl aminopeptidase/acylaminoacyl peptidase